MVLGKEHTILGELAFAGVQANVFLSCAETQAKLGCFSHELLWLIGLMWKSVELKVEVVVDSGILEASGFRDRVPQTRHILH